jgi:hypothetical protein
MREEIRLGNEALAQKDLDTAVGYFQQLLNAGGTVVQERIALNRLREIETLRAQASSQQQDASGKPRGRRSPAARTKKNPEVKHRFVRIPERPVVTINRH